MFFALFRSDWTYSCAYFERDPLPARTIGRQADLTLGKLGLEPGMTARRGLRLGRS